MKIKITCKGSRKVPIETLKNFQGNLKELPETELEKLKRSILKHGFTFPVFVWQNFILDGHQRIFSVNKLIEDGHTIGKIPVVEIQAKDKKEAAEKLLILNSRYGQMTKGGFSEFIEANEINLEEIHDELELPEIDIQQFFESSKVTKLLEPERKLGKKSAQIKPVLYSEHIGIFEKALNLTGEHNRGVALIQICHHFIDSKNEKR